MTLRKRIVDHIARTVSVGEACEANILLGLLIASFAGCAGGFLEATTVQLSEFLHSRYKAATTIARRLSTMRLIFAALLEWGLIKNDPATALERPLIVDKATDFSVSSADVERLVASQESFVKCFDGLIDDVAHQERVVLAMMHLVASGAFLSEIGGLTLRDFRAHTVVVGRGSGRERCIWPSDAALGAISAAAHAARPLPPAPDSPLLVLTRRLNTSTGWNLLQRAIVRADMAKTGLTPAKIHRAAAKALIERGFGWNEARNPSGYRLIPRVGKTPSVEEMEREIARCHPLEFV
jgi:site-specific recombinase XerD